MMRAWLESVKRGVRRVVPDYRGLVVAGLGLGAVCGFAVVLLAAFETSSVVVADDTRVECFTRCLTAFAGAASANEPRAPRATSATSNVFIVLRIMECPLFPEFPRNSILGRRNHSAPTASVQRSGRSQSSRGTCRSESSPRVGSFRSSGLQTPKLCRRTREPECIERPDPSDARLRRRLET